MKQCLFIAPLGLASALACAQGNLVRNAGLDEGMFAPHYWAMNEPLGNKVTWMVAGEERHALRLKGVGRDWAGATSAKAAAKAGMVFTVAAWVRTEGGAEERDRLFVRCYDGGKFIGQWGPSVNGAEGRWRIVAGTVTAPEGTTRVDVSLQVWSAATVWLASPALFGGDVAAQVEKLLPAAPPAEGWTEVKVPVGLAPDVNGNGIPDPIEEALQIKPEERARSIRRTREKTTSFQTPTGYREDNDLKVDVVIVAGNSESALRSWRAMGYEAHCMVGFRAGPDYLDGGYDGRNHRDEAQTDGNGDALRIGQSHYMVPTENRRAIFRKYFEDAIARGAQAVCPEEPEFFARAGYSPAFKREWQERYGEPWRDPASSVQARYMSEKLKGALEVRMLTDIYTASRKVAPDIPRFCLTHSPLNYTAWGIVFPHCAALRTGQVDAVVGQVWTGTARSGVMYAGQRKQRTFENGYLEYSSLVNLTRGLGVELWFLMDPLEDNPNLPMEDYHLNYERTLLASLMFPSVHKYETMPWPTRIFGRVPPEFATEICTIINALSDMQNQKSFRWDRGTEGIATFISDSAMYQRGAPSPSDMSCIYGLALPLLTNGVPVEMAHLDRVADEGYLDAYRVLLLSYDAMKPLTPDINAALERWVRRGGCLAVFGGQDAYNDVDEWWRKGGFESPQDELLARLGLNVKGRQALAPNSLNVRWQTVAETDYAGRNLENQKVETIDLTPFLARADGALVKVEDTIKEDGWGPLITRIEADGVRDGKPLKLQAPPGTDEEAKLIAADGGSALTPDGKARFCDAERYVIYRLRFDRGTKAVLRIEVGNQYRISAAPMPPESVRTFACGEGRPFRGKLTRWDVPPAASVTTYADLGGRVLCRQEAGGRALIGEKDVGKGAVVFVGVSPSVFAQSQEGAVRLRELARYLVERHAGAEYREQGYLRVDRGRYVAAKTFGGSLTVRGRYVDLLKPDLPIVRSVSLGPGEWCLLYDVAADMGKEPRLLYSSSCVEWKSEEPLRTRLFVSGALGVRGTCRVYTGGMKSASVRAVDARRRPVEITVEQQGETMRLSYDNQTQGLGVVIDWGA